MFLVSLKRSTKSRNGDQGADHSDVYMSVYAVLYQDHYSERFTHILKDNREPAELLASLQMRPTLKSPEMLANALIQRSRKASTVTALRLVWLVTVAWYELGVFFWGVAQCEWPDRAFTYDGMQNSIGSPAHILLIADPQVLDKNSYPERGYVLGLLSQIVVDLNMRKSWSAIRRLLLGRSRQNGNNGDAVVVLGDMMDNGRSDYSDAEYEKYVSRFKSIFSTDGSTKVYYIPGNHDVGLGSSRKFSPHTRSRYTKHFGPLNHKMLFGNHTLVMLDAPGFVEEDYRRSSAGQRFEDWKPPIGGVVDFVNEFASVGSRDPVVLFSHIPLFRPDTAYCGPLRERGTIRRGVGFGYQNTLGRQTSEFILKNIRPSVIFSGDDHDYCEYTHSIPLLSEGPESTIEFVREVTVKSFSIAMGIRNPGFQLLSLADPSAISPGTNSYADVPCFLPDQIAIYLNRYLPLFVFSLCVLAVSSFRKLHDRRSRNGHYNLDIDPNDVSLTESSPESVFPGSLGSARFLPSGSGNGGLARTYRAASTTLPNTPYTPDFNVTPGGRVATPNLLSAPPAGLGISPGDVELGYIPRDYSDGDSVPEYAEQRMPNGTFFKPISGRSPNSKRRLTWSWTFTLRGRRRRMAVGVPHVLKQVIIKLAHRCRFGDVYSQLIRDRRGSKGRVYGAESQSAAMVFMCELTRIAWPPVLVFALINVFVSL